VSGTTVVIGIVRAGKQNRVAGRPFDLIYSNLNLVIKEGKMRRLKKVAAIVSLWMVISMSASFSALAGTQEQPGHSLRITAEAPGVSATGVIETPGFDEIILFTMMLMM
jgi:hypothetical protein